MTQQAEDQDMQAMVSSLLRQVIELTCQKVDAHPLSLGVSMLENLAGGLIEVDRDAGLAYLEALVPYMRAISAKQPAQAEYDALVAAFESMAVHYPDYTQRLQAIEKPATPADEVPQQILRDKPDGSELDVQPWCSELVSEVNQRLVKQAGSAAAFTLVAYYEADGLPRVQCLAGHMEQTTDDAVKHLVNCAAAACETYAKVGNPNKPLPGQSVQ